MSGARSSRALRFAFTRPKVLLFAALGGALTFWGAPATAVGVMFAIAGFKAWKVLSYSDLDDRLRLQDQKRGAGIHRMLRNGERAEILAIDHYATMLKEAGATIELADETVAEAWKIIRSAGPADATSRLKLYRHTLPTLRQPENTVHDEPAGVATKIERELHLLRATRRELELVG